MFTDWKLLADKTDIGHSRTSVLNPLQWTLVILFLGLCILVAANADYWIILAVLICTLLCFALLAAAYIFFMFKNPDALRSEDFSLHKLAMEKGLYGDSIHGLNTIDASTGIVATKGKAPEEQQEL